MTRMTDVDSWKTRLRIGRRRGHLPLGALGLLIGLTWACGDQPSAPAGPTGPAVPQSQARGYVSDTAFQPVGGVRVEVLDGPTVGTSAISGSDGWFNISVPSDREFIVHTTKAGYVDVVATFTTFTSSYGTFFRGYLILDSTVAPVAFQPGAYTVTLDLPCLEIPADLRTQTFQAAVTARPNTPPGTNFIVSIDDERFRQFNFNRLEFGVSGSAIGVREEDDLWWEAPALRYFEGLTVGKVATPGSAATFSTRVDVAYCELNAPKGISWPTNYCEAMPAAQLITRAYCPHGRLTLAPR